MTETRHVWMQRFECLTCDVRWNERGAASLGTPTCWACESSEAVARVTHFGQPLSVLVEVKE